MLTPTPRRNVRLWNWCRFMIVVSLLKKWGARRFFFVIRIPGDLELSRAS
jgi:hypothetical protein